MSADPAHLTLTNPPPPTRTRHATVGPRHRAAADPRADARERLPVCWALTVPVVAFAAVPALQVESWRWLSLCLAAPVVVWGATPFHRAATRALARGTATVDTLLSVAVLAAFGWSLYLLLAGGAVGATASDRFWSVPRHGLGPGHLYLAVAAVLTVVELAGRSIERPAPRPISAYAVGVGAAAAGTFGFWLTTDGPVPASATAAGVLIVACPIALALAGPAAHAAADRRAAQLGIVLRSPTALTEAPRIDTVVFAPTDLDEPAPGPAAALAELRRLGVGTVLLTSGDPQGALALAGRVGIAEVFAAIAPTDRAAVVRRLQDEGRTVAFVGETADPHDRPALAQAELGLARHDAAAPATATLRAGGERAPQVEIAAAQAAETEAAGADVVLADGDPWSATDAVRLARTTRRTADANRALAFTGSVAVLPIAAAGLLNPLIALGAPAIAALGIAANSLRLRSFRSARPPAHRR
jgi:cation transport ATPase